MTMFSLFSKAKNAVANGAKALHNKKKNNSQESTSFFGNAVSTFLSLKIKLSLIFAGCIFFIVLIVFAIILSIPEQIIEAFNNLSKGINNSAGSAGSAGSVCYYKVPYIDEEVYNLKVQTIQCEFGNKSGSKYDDIPGEGLIDFESVYLPGVVRAETGGADENTTKAQAVAARSFALTRHMPAANIGITLENGQWVLRIRTCTSDQVFCHPTLGCHSVTGSMQGTTSGGDTVYSGPDENGNYSGSNRAPLPEDSSIFSNVEATKGQVAVDSSGNIVNTGYVSTDQNAWASMSASGMDYKNIIIDHYKSKGVTGVVSDCRGGGGGNGIYTTEQLEEYVQLSNAAPVTNNWANADLASTEYGSIEGLSKHIKDNVNNAGYGTRQAVVAAGVSLIGDYIRATGKRARYDQAQRHPWEVEGIIRDNLYFDCSSFAWWALYNGGFKVPTHAYTGDQRSWANSNGYLKTPGPGVGQGGDFLISGGHIILIIGNYDGGYYVAHASSWTNGLKINKLDYNSARASYDVIDMTEYYNNSSNVR